MPSLARVALAVALALPYTAAEQISDLSFNPPFNSQAKSNGQRSVQGWNVGGTTEVQKGFIRLTPDRQSKQGYIWSNTNLVQGESKEFSVVLQFRISGQGEKFFGDGIGLWISQTSYYSGGTLHAAPEDFVGIGIILDTFKNSENAHLHKDVAILINDGKQTTEDMLKDASGCDALVRYHEKRADFSTSNSSRVKVSWGQDMLKVEVDAQSDGVWEPCAEFSPKNLPVNWEKGAFVGISAATGGLADNHDILSLNAYTKKVDQDTMRLDAGLAHEFKPLTERFADGSVEMLRAELKELKSELEHKLAAVDNALKESFKKLSAREDDDKKRIEALETQFHDVVSEDTCHALPNCSRHDY
jgi:mannose-binding lectin 2